MNLMIILFLLMPLIECQRKESLKFESQYASALFRQNHILESVTQIDIITNVSLRSHCLLNCLKRKPDCKSFNWGNGVCILMSDSLCANDSLILVPKQDFAYYDVMDSPDFEVSLLLQYVFQMFRLNDLNV